MNESDEFLDAYITATNWTALATEASALIAQAISFQQGYEPDGDIAELNREWRTESIPNPVTVYHETYRALLQGIGDLMIGLRPALQIGSLPLLVTTAALTRSVCEYSSRILYVADHEQPLEVRLGRMGSMLYSGFDSAGGRNPRSPDNMRTTAEEFYDWYATTNPRLQGGRQFDPSEETFAKTLGKVYQSNMYRLISDYTHGNGAAILAIHQATNNGRLLALRRYVAANSVSRVFYALDCAFLASRTALHFTDPTDTRTVSDILDYLNLDSEFTSLTPTDLLALAESETQQAKANWAVSIDALQRDDDDENQRDDDDENQRDNN
ncbi:hypothetical protein HUN08_04190 [Gordonia sp. X0973]|uniref:hypothetical protein n=1 Tax=Gordonia sp. X0973 TaxID=2742602 RepID=UPI000F51B8D5|nr:hypothetical protein [Gordonia sp. X0973]QKT06477.1 hypothetical protein HUN08_04190 [Gordonia sp. X0973]